MTGMIQKVLALGKLLTSRVFVVFTLALVVGCTVFHAHSRTRMVEIREGDEVQTYYTMAENPQEILSDFGYETTPHDEVEVTLPYRRQMEIRITRAYPVILACDGVKSTVMTTGGSVRDILAQADISLGAMDSVNRPLGRLAREGDTITVTRKEERTWQEETQLPFETVAIPTSLLAPGRQKVLQEGRTGQQVDTFEALVVDGKEAKTRLVEKEVLQKPLARKVLVGQTAHPISPLDFGRQLDAGGEPTQYAQVFRGQRAAGYSARPGARTASGREAVVGHVAVDPNLIPYGSKLYIKSTDGSFVYGYAIAADTGTAIRDGVIAVDLFYGSYMESALNGIKSVDIFVLE